MSSEQQGPAAAAAAAAAGAPAPAPPPQQQQPYMLHFDHQLSFHHLPRCTYFANILLCNIWKLQTD